MGNFKKQPEEFSFPRKQLADDFVKSFSKGNFPLPDNSSGLFLSAPRRTGKSYFLENDLVPALKQAGIIPIYVDLWKNKDTDPVILILDAAQQAIDDNSGVADKTINFLKTITKVSAKFKEFSIDIAKDNGDRTGILISLITEAIETLIKKSVNGRVALLIDEAQHALTTETGINSMFALKSARDHFNLNKELGTRLLLVFTGSHRDKLANMVLKRDQPFYGANLTDFPLLDHKYSDAFTSWANSRLADDNQFNPKEVDEAFNILGHRPEMLINLLSELAMVKIPKDARHQTLVEHAYQLREKMFDEFEVTFSSLNKLQQTVLLLMIKNKNTLSPYSEDSMRAYKIGTGGDKIDTSAVQAAIKVLREKNIIWQSSRGAYALDDQSMEHWYSNKLTVKSDDFEVAEDAKHLSTT